MEWRDDPEQAAEQFMRRLIGDDRWDKLPPTSREARRAEGPAMIGELSNLRAHAPWARRLTSRSSPVVTKAKPRLVPMPLSEQESPALSSRIQIRSRKSTAAGYGSCERQASRSKSESAKIKLEL